MDSRLPITVVRSARIPREEWWSRSAFLVALRSGRDGRRARLDRDRDGLLVFFFGVVFFCAALPEYLFAGLLVAAAPVVMLASRITISQLAPYASRRVAGQWGGTGGAICEEHFYLARAFWAFAWA